MEEEKHYYIQENVVDAAAVESFKEAVRIMTIHQPKRLEFPIVVIGAAME